MIFLNKIGFVLLLITMGACGVYTFSGASISPDIKTMSIAQFLNNAPIVEPTLAQTLSEKLRDRFLSQTPLSLVRDEGDVSFEGTITDYVVTTTGVQSNETASQNRLTITIKVIFKNVKDSKQDWEQTFSRFQDFPASQTFAQVERNLINSITDQLAEDVFNKAFVNW